MNDELQKEINELLDFEEEVNPIEEDKENDEKVIDDSEKTPEEIPEEDEEEIEKERELVVEEDKEEEIEEEKTSDDEEVNDLDELRKQNESLLKQVEELAGKGDQRQEEPQEQIKLDTVFEDINLDDIIDSEENFKEFFTKFASAIRTSTTENVLKMIPEVTGKFIIQKEAMNKVRDNFYSNHPELANVKQYVANVANTVSAEHPDWTVPDVLEEAAKRTKDALGLKNVIQKDERRKSRKKPAFAKTRGSKRGKAEPKLSALQQEIDDLNSDY